MNFGQAIEELTELLAAFNEPVVVDEIGMAGMVVRKRKADGFQGMSFPSDLKMPNAALTGAEGVRVEGIVMQRTTGDSDGT